MNPLLEYKRIKEAVFSKHPLGLNRTLPKSENCEFKKRGKEKIKDPREEKIKNSGKADISTPHNRTALQRRNSQRFSPRPRQAFQHKHSNNANHFNDAPHGGYANGRKENWEKRTYEISQEEKCVASEDLELSLVYPDGPKSNAGMVVYKYCYICETGKPCFCSEENYDYEKDTSNWDGGKMKPNIHSTFRDISNIIETIHSNKKKKEGDNINVWAKGQAGKATGKKDLPSKKKRIGQKNEATKQLSTYHRFYLQQMKTIKSRLECWREGRVWNEDTTDKGAHTGSKVNMDIDQNGSAMEKRMDALMEIEKKHLQLLVSLFDEYKNLEEKML
ncbi:conserved Plasmodium protein, unknown function [Plasmodium knowlesi strain H]|uniref:Uncharacterized protein n=3 Tax=Plasmodium knowlesi TaxID=5850 RepID=A0A5E7X3K4_PLAKH|nr:conserved Plasmodium protein, unknown function [Plasmodium knowlesi strain H]OTN65181.1 Uncharacterized protein PKNOH_S120162500 [Plasmodium knowlesi]CAA9988481.1 conserved Plasmodium protein, unknown function [Plasmodium knowlesi strain H]SBO19745.1 conserved Plasmodium protein, unknown function [Plasmodium knowlesi strain H]SBO20484.1 conserved Plasmodium protein, unknown function [Plasmodium knowlesi strain H]VVS77955.1 conserved Plasmodium protein, unknown function [Plasmodium knowlesi 